MNSFLMAQAVHEMYQHHGFRVVIGGKIHCQGVRGVYEPREFRGAGACDVLKRTLTTSNARAGRVLIRRTAVFSR